MKIKWQNIPPALYLIVILFLVFGCTVDNYFTLDNLSVVLRQAAPLLCIACGQTVVVLTQGTDLSLGSIVSFTSVLWIFLLNQGVPMGAAVFLMLAASAACGLVNGLIAAKVHIPVFIVTLGTQNIFKSAALLLCGSLTIYYSHPLFRTVALGKIFHLSISTWIAFGVFILTVVIITRTRFGMKVRALGGNPEALSLSGARLDWNMIKVFIYAGLMAGIGGFLLACRIESGNPNSGNGLEFSAVAAVLLGGISLREGRGNVGGMIFGVLLIQILKSGLMQVGVSSIYQNAIIGIVVVCAIIFDALMKRYREDHEGTGEGEVEG